MGENIDRLIAERVMGWRRGDCGWYTVPNCTLNDFRFDKEWHPSTSISDAWMVVEKMKRDGWRVSVEDFDNRYRLNFSRGMRWMSELNVEHINVPLGICLAALKALGIASPGEGGGGNER